MTLHSDFCSGSLGWAVIKRLRDAKSHCAESFITLELPQTGRARVERKPGAAGRAGKGLPEGNGSRPMLGKSQVCLHGFRAMPTCSQEKEG